MNSRWRTGMHAANICFCGRLGTNCNAAKPDLQPAGTQGAAMCHALRGLTLLRAGSKDIPHQSHECRGGQSSMTKLKHAMVCASNMNRSCAAHALLKEEGFDVSSFGVGGRVKLPGATASTPNCYTFGQVTYADIYADLAAKDEALYTRNGLLPMLRRNMTIKPAPQRWQDNGVDQFDVVLTFDRRVMDQVVLDFNSRQQSSMKPALVCNIEVKDSPSEAVNAAPQALLLCRMLEEAEDWESEIDSILTHFEQQTGRLPLFTICWW